MVMTYKSGKIIISCFTYLDNFLEKTSILILILCSVVQKKVLSDILGLRTLKKFKSYEKKNYIC